MSSARALLRREGRTRNGRSFLIRPARDDDAAELVALRDAVAAEPGLLATVPGETSATEEALRVSALLAAGDLAVVAEVDGTLCAHCMVWRRPGRYERHVAGIAIIVSNVARGQGIGGALVSTAVSWCEAVGVAKLELGVFADNTHAIDVYRRLGFVEEGMRRRAVRMPEAEHDLLLMALDLPASRASPAILETR